MRRIGLAVLMGIMFSLPLRAGQEAPDTSWLRPLDGALGEMLMTRQDLRFRADYEDVDPFRLQIVTELMQKPLEVPAKTTEYCKILGHEPSLGGVLLKCNSILQPSPSNVPYFWRQTDYILFSDGAVRYYPTVHLNALPDFLRPTVELLVSQMESDLAIVRSSYDSLSPEEKRFLQDSLPYFIRGMSDTQEREPDEQKRLDAEMESLTYRLMGKVNKTRSAHFYLAAYDLCEATERAIGQLKNISPEYLKRIKRQKFDTSAQGDVLFAEQTPIGEVIIGGPGKTIYTKRAALIIDFGGDDEYLAGAGGATPDLPVSVCIDLRGNDTYNAREDFSLGSAFMGVGILADCEGDDKYLGGSLSQGCGLLGVGILWDQGGDDTYDGDLCCQGAGLWGIGILKDDKGNDKYIAKIFSQGFGFCAGLGALLEGEGNDTYYAGGKYTDTNRYFDHYLSMSQGFGFGLRPDYSGGIGLIYDGKGNDTYITDIFGQGGSYWFSLGGILDEEGNDSYIGYQYSQGSGIHLSLGAVVDEAGNDSYVSNGVAQGCGHDFGAGFLIDRQGNDNYVASGLSQGAGSANGIGIQVDEAGDDGYTVKDFNNTQGYGDPRREFGSVGIVMDLLGNDHFIGPGKEKTWWTGGKWGLGWDIDSLTVKQLDGWTAAQPLKALNPKLNPPVLPAMRPPEPEPKDSIEREVDHLFNQSTSGLKKYDPMVKPSVDSLIAMGGKAVPRLLEKLNTKSATDRNRVDELFLGIGKPAAPYLVKYLERNDLRGTRAALYYLGRVGDEEDLAAILHFVNNQDWRVRSSAIDGLGRLKLPEKDEPQRRAILVDALKDSVENVRRVAALALGEPKDPAAVPALINALEDDYYGTRYDAEASLVKIGAPARAALLKRAEKESQNSKPEERIARALAVQALGEIKGAGPNPLKRFIGDSDWMVRLNAVAGLDSVLTPQEREALRKQASVEKNPFVAQKIAQALEKPVAKPMEPHRKRNG